MKKAWKPATALRGWGWFLGLAFGISAPAYAEVEVCVLFFERKDHPFSKYIREVSQDPRIALYEQALPTDYLKCLQENPREIIWIAHSIPSAHGSWGYVKELHGREREEFLNARKDALLAFRRKHPKKSARRMQKTLDAIDRLLGNREPVHGPPQLITAKVFREGLAYSRKQRARGVPLRLKRFRFLSCADHAPSRYPELMQMIQEGGIQVDLAPRQNLQSWLSGRSKRNLDPEWLKESLQFPEAAHDSFNAYLKLRTWGAYRSGSSTALRGKYKIRVRGAALGLGSKWSLVNIQYRHVLDLAVGERKRILIPHVNTSVAFGVNIDLILAPKFRVQLPSEINSLGISQGFASVIELERVY